MVLLKDGKRLAAVPGKLNKKPTGISEKPQSDIDL